MHDYLSLVDNREKNMWKNIPIEAKERFGMEGWQRKITQNHPRHWSTCSNDYGMFTTQTVRWRLEQEASPQKPTSASAPWETTNGFYGGRQGLSKKQTYREHVTAAAMTAPGGPSRYQRSRRHPLPGTRLQHIQGRSAKDGYCVRSQMSYSPTPKSKAPHHLPHKVKVPGIHEKFLDTKYVIPWKVSKCRPL